MNTYGVGWKKHGKDGRFMKRRSFPDLLLSFLLGSLVVESIVLFILYFL